MEEIVDAMSDPPIPKGEGVSMRLVEVGIETFDLRLWNEISTRSLFVALAT